METGDSSLVLITDRHSLQWVCVCSSFYFPSTKEREEDGQEGHTPVQFQPSFIWWAEDGCVGRPGDGVGWSNAGQLIKPVDSRALQDDKEEGRAAPHEELHWGSHHNEWCRVARGWTDQLIVHNIINAVATTIFFFQSQIQRRPIQSACLCIPYSSKI